MSFKEFFYDYEFRQTKNLWLDYFGIISLCFVYGFINEVYFHRETARLTFEIVPLALTLRVLITLLRYYMGKNQPNGKT